jgi:hypothetical protein
MGLDREQRLKSHHGGEEQAQRRAFLMEFAYIICAGSDAGHKITHFIQRQFIRGRAAREVLGLSELTQQQFHLPGQVVKVQAKEGHIGVEPLLQEAAAGHNAVVTRGYACVFVLEGETGAVGVVGTERGIGVGGGGRATRPSGGGARGAGADWGKGRRSEPGMGGAAGRIAAGDGAALADSMAEAAGISDASGAARGRRPEWFGAAGMGAAKRGIGAGDGGGATGLAAAGGGGAGAGGMPGGVLTRGVGMAARWT